MSRATLLALSSSVLLGAAVAAPSAALAQFGLPPPPPAFVGPPPSLGAGVPPPAFAAGAPPAAAVAGIPPHGVVGAPPRDPAGGPRLGGPSELRGLARNGQANFSAVEGRAGHRANSYRYGREDGLGYRYGLYAASAATYAYDRSYGSSDDGCAHVSTYTRYGHRRVLICHAN